MLETIGNWWNHNKSEVGKCVFITLGALVWYVSRELMVRQRLPFVSADHPSHPLDHHGQHSPSREA